MRTEIWPENAGTCTMRSTMRWAVAGLGGNPYRDGSYEYYVKEPVRNNDPKGVGPFILASLEFERGAPRPN